MGKSRDACERARQQLTELIAARSQPRERHRLVGRERDASERAAHAVPQDARRVRASARFDAPGSGRARGAHAIPADADHRIVDDPFGAYIDLLSFNQYVGWYDGLPDKLPRIRWTFGYDKPVVISEFGADALQGRHGDRLARFSEEYQEDLYRQTLLMLQRLPQWRGTTPWILADFRSPRRPLPGVQDGWNRKGLISDKGAKKKAFYVLQDFYSEHRTA